MAITFTNGSKYTRQYEELGLSLSRLHDFTVMYNHHLSSIAKDINKRYAELKADFDGKLIGAETYRQYLGYLKTYFETHKENFHPELNKEIQVEIKNVLVNDNRG